MGIARDGLRSLLDALVESIETGGSGDEIAARVHVSRFHFDRIVAAALDEAPGAFRRRLLLERAAYSLAGGASVGEAALEGATSRRRRSRARSGGRTASLRARSPVAAFRSGCRHRTESTSTLRGRCSSPAEKGTTPWT